MACPKRTSGATLTTVSSGTFRADNGLLRDMEACWCLQYKRFCVKFGEICSCEGRPAIGYAFLGYVPFQSDRVGDSILGKPRQTTTPQRWKGILDPKLPVQTV